MRTPGTRASPICCPRLCEEKERIGEQVQSYKETHHIVLGKKSK